MFCLPLFSLKMPAFRKGSEFVIKHVENGNNVHNQRTYAVFPTCAMLKGSITVGLLMNGLLFSYKTLLNVPEGLWGWFFDLVSVNVLYHKLTSFSKCRRILRENNGRQNMTEIDHSFNQISR